MAAIESTLRAQPARRIFGLSDSEANEIRQALSHAFGERLRAVYVYGSRARGDGVRDDSDLDILIVLNEVRGIISEIDAAVHATYPLQLRLEFPIHHAFASLADFDRQDRLLYQEVLSEGILL